MRFFFCKKLNDMKLVQRNSCNTDRPQEKKNILPTYHILKCYVTGNTGIILLGLMYKCVLHSSARMFAIKMCQNYVTS